MKWVLASVWDVKVKEIANDKWYKMKGTLLSGWRLTTFMNTVLNYVYMEIAGVFNTSGIVDSVHNGDDVLLAINNVSSVTKMFYKMGKINARAQAKKCNAFAVGEFLRIEHKTESDESEGMQYLTRACATACHGRTESQQPTDALELIGAHATRCSELKSRMRGDKYIVGNMLQLLVRRVEKEFGLMKGIGNIYLNAHKVVGGYRSDIRGKINKTLERIQSKEIQNNKPGEIRSVHDSEVVELVHLLPGVYDYSRLLVSTMKLHGLEDKVFSSVVRGTRAVLEIEKTQVINLTNVSGQSKYRYARALSGRLKGIVPLGGASKARFLGLPPLSLVSDKQREALILALGDTSDKVWALQVLC
jgi:hypothetical protein